MNYDDCEDCRKVYDAAASFLEAAMAELGSMPLSCSEGDVSPQLRSAWCRHVMMIAMVQAEMRAESVNPVRALVNLSTRTLSAIRAKQD